MNNIESSPYPLVFKANIDGEFPSVTFNGADSANVAAVTRALEGMQKECLLHYGPDNAVWRVVCDEGPWLNGTDLAPFPLGFFTAGLVASYMSEFLAHAKSANIEIDDLEVMVDNHYSMEGSLLKGTMVAGALPVEVSFRVKSSADKQLLQQLAYQSIASSAADAYLRNAQSGVFSLNSNGNDLPVEDSELSPLSADPIAVFDSVAFDGNPLGDEKIIEKLPDVDQLGGEKLGTERAKGDVGLSDEQKRQVHVRGVGSLREDGLKSIQVACFNPIGSVFKFLSDDSELVGGQGRAPSGLAYLSAGLTFCFMTQLGRYASVAKQQLNSYHILQETTFPLSNKTSAPLGSNPVKTYVFLGTDEDEKQSLKLLSMGEQTCYLHAAGRNAIKTRISFSKA